MSSKFFYLLTEDNYTSYLASTEPAWGRDLVGVPLAGRFEMTPWQHLAHVLVHSMARHPARSSDAASSTCCVVASPAERNFHDPCGGDKLDVVAKLTALGERICPGRPIVVVDGPDSDGTKDALCNSIWSPAACAKGQNDVLVRQSGNAPGLQSEVATRLQRGLCRYLPPTPYLAHARSAGASVAAANGARRKVRIAYAAASWGHMDAERHGFVAWRKALRNACKGLHKEVNASACEWVWISMSGMGAEDAIQMYQSSDFCLQPPGDTLPRPGILDSLTTGCVPVIFHPGQATLWPTHFHAHKANPPSAVLFDWTEGFGPRPKHRDRDYPKYAPRAKAALKTLLEMPHDKLLELRRGVEMEAKGVVYSRGGHVPGDAVDHVVENMRTLRRYPDAAEAARYSEQLAHRLKQIEAQQQYEDRGGRKGSWAGLKSEMKVGL